MRYALGECILDTQRRELSCAGVPVKLQRKVYQVLAYLIEHRDHLVTKEELLEHVWAGVYVEDYAVARCITAARRAVGDSRTAQRVIQTLHGQGYCFVAPVVVEGPAQPPVEAVDIAGPPLPSPPIVQPPASTAISTLSPQEPVRVSEHKLVTVLCCRWTLPSALPSRLDLDSLHEMQQAVEALLQQTMRPYGGMLQHVESHGGEMIFGAPVAQEDHAPRAVLAALELQQRWQELTGVLGSPAAAVPILQIGLHTGPVVVEMREDNVPQHLTVVGEIPTLAVALAQQAVPGSVVVSAAVARLLPEDVRLEAMPLAPLVGEPRPLAAYRVLGWEPEHAPRGRLRRDWSSSFVGRDEELAALRHHLARVREGQGQVVGIVGEPGIGKTRLLAEFQQRLAEQSGTYLAGRCQAYGRATPYLPLGQLVRQLWGLMEGDSPAVCRAKVHAGLQHRGMDADASAPALLDLLGLAEVTELWAGLSPQARKARIFATLHQLLLDSSQAQTLVVEIDNLHWADPSTEEYLTALVPRLGGARILLLVSYRPGYRPPWIGSSVATQIALHRLAPYHSRRLVQAALRRQSLPDAVLQQILTKAGGNPLFLEELALAVSEQGEAAQTFAVPDTIQAVLAARIDRLLPVAKYLLQTAAVIGPEVPEPLLRGLVTLPEAVLAESLAHLQTSELLFETRVLPTPTYTFKHALTQEVAYQSLLRRTRRQIHAQIVQVISEHFPELAEAQPERLAHHYAEAGWWEPAIDAWQQAGQRAVDRCAYLEALAHLTHALEALKTLPATPAQVRRELAALTTLGPALVATRGHASPEVEQTYARARVLCEQVGETPRLFPALRGLCRFYLSRGALPTAREVGEQLYALAQRAAEPTALLEAQDALGTTLFHLGAYAAAWTDFEPSLALTDPTSQRTLGLRDDVSPGVRCLAVAANTLWCLGYPAQALQRSQEALALAQSLGHPYSLAQAHYWAAFLHHRRRDAPAVQAQAEALLTLATAQGFPLWVSFGTCWLGWARAMQGEGAASLTPMRQGLTTILATGQTLSQPLCLVLLAEAAGRAGQVDEGLRLLAEALVAFTASGRGDLLAEAYRLQGALLLQQARPAAAQAEACFQQALAVARRQQARTWELRAASSLARLWQQQGKREEARRLLVEVYGWFSEGFDTADLQEAKALLHILT